MTTTTHAFRAVAIRDGLKSAIEDCITTDRPIPLTRETVEGEGWGDLWDSSSWKRLCYEIDSQLGVPSRTLDSSSRQLLHDAHGGVTAFGEPRRIQDAPYNADIAVYGCAMWPEDKQAGVPYVDFIIAPTSMDPTDIAP